MPERLKSIWKEVNERYFAGYLEPLAEIDWGETSGEGGIGAHGVYFHKSRCIAIDENFKFDNKLVKSGDKNENAKLEITYRVLIHEMIHQALHQKDDPKFGKHQQSFLDEAVRIAAIMEEEPPTLNDVARWPRIESLLAEIRS